MKSITIQLNFSDQVPYLFISLFNIDSIVSEFPGSTPEETLSGILTWFNWIQLWISLAINDQAIYNQEMNQSKGEIIIIIKNNVWLFQFLYIYVHILYIIFR